MGQVYDRITNEPLSGVNVVLISSELGAATDLDGDFTILNVPPGTYIINFSFLGYQSITRSDVIVASAKPTVINEFLTPVTLLGDEVTVNLGLFRDELKAPVSTTQLSREEIRRYPGGFEDVVRTVSTLPGVAVVNEGGRNDLLVRGGGPSENLYVVDGMEVPNINHFGTQGSSSGSLSFINLDFVDEVEFSSGGFGAEFGDKLSSVISLRMRPGRADRFGGKALVSATQFGMDAEGPLGERGSIIASARKSYLDLLFRALGQPFIPVYTDYNLFATYNVTPRDRLFFLGLAAIDLVDRDQTTLENRVINAGIMDNTQDQIVTGIKYQRIRRSSVTRLTCNLNSVAYRFSQVDNQEEEYFHSETKEREGVLKAESEVRLTDKLKLTSGGTVKQGWIDSRTEFADTIYDRSGQRLPISSLGLPQEIRGDLTARKYAVFLSLTQEWTPVLETTLGVRGDYYDFINDKFYPTVRVSIRYRLNSLTTLKSSGGIYFQSPSYAWVLNPYNRALSALRNDMGVVGINYLIRDYLSVEVEGYYKQYSDLPTGATPGLSYLVLTNSGVGYGGREDDFQSFGFIPLTSSATGKAYGVEISLQKKYSKDCCYGQAALSIGRSEYTAGNGETYPGQFDQTVVFSFNWGFKPNPRWEYSMKFRVWTGAPYTPVYRPSENNGVIQNVPEEYLSERLEPGHHLDLRVDRRFNFTGWTLIAFVDVQNVYDNKIERQPTYNFWTDKVENTNTIGILPSIGVSVEF